MQRRMLGALAGLILAAGAGAGFAQAADPITSPAKHITFLDYDSGQILYCRDCQEPMQPASMSKLMTILIVEDQLKAGKIKMSTTFPVSEKAWRYGAQSDGSHMFLELNSRVSVEDLIKGVIIVSANDACIALAEGIAGSEEAFVSMMNDRARSMGLKHSQFRNVTGLPDPEHLVSSEDLARIAATLIRDYPAVYKTYSQRELTYNGKTQQNRNPLLGRFEGADGVKTGHTAEAGYGLVGSAVFDGRRRIIVFNGLPTMAARTSEAVALMRAAVSQFAVTNLFEKDAVVAEADVWMGGKKTVPLVAPKQIMVAWRRSLEGGVKAHVEYKGPLPAPIKKGDVVAKLVVEGPDLRQEYDLVAGRDVGRANPIERAVLGLRRLMGGG